MSIELKYGPVGDPKSAEPWKRAQAHAPFGWHVEGQMLWVSTHGRYQLRAEARGPRADGTPGWAWGYGQNRDEAANDLIVTMTLAHRG